MDERDLIDAVARSPLPMVASNPRRRDNPLEFVNDAFCRLTGYTERDVVGRNCRFLAGTGVPSTRVRPVREAIRARRPVLAELVNYRRDGSAFRNGVMITPLIGPGDGVDWFLGSQVDLGRPKENGLEGLRTRAL